MVANLHVSPLCHAVIEGKRERERESCGTGILFEEPNPTFIQGGNRAPVSKATHSRYRGGTPLTRE